MTPSPGLLELSQAQTRMHAHAGKIPFPLLPRLVSAGVKGSFFRTVSILAAH